MKAVLFRGKDHPLTVEDVAKPKPAKDQVLVKIHYAALNHRDLWIQQDQSQLPGSVILGSDGCGVVEDTGEEADGSLKGREVVINPGMGWGTNPVVQGNAFKILGFPDNGTLAEYIVVPEKHVFEKPAHLSSAEAAALPLAALTAYRALFTKARLRKGEKVLITGIGGGAALWLLQFAVAYEAKVYVTSGSPEKINKAVGIGALKGFNYKEADWADKAQKETGGFDIIIDSAGGEHFSELIELALPGGRIVNFGRTAGSIKAINTRLMYWKQLSIFGSTMGTHDEFLSMLHFVENRKLRAVIDKIYPMDHIQDAYKRMHEGDQFGKIVIDIGG